MLKSDNSGYLSALPIGSTVIRAGCRDVRSASCRLINVEWMAAHPCYTPSYVQDHDDIALMRLQTPVHDILLPHVDGLNGSVASSVTADRNVTLAGFGVTSNDAVTVPRYLMHVDGVPIASRSVCQTANPTAHKMGLINFGHVFCVGGHQGRDSCFGDSGGPCILNAGSKHWVIGVLSRGSEKPQGTSDCAVEGRFAVYTRVGVYGDFVRSVLEASGCCS
jgi:secreted trypsin-like serine protease